MRVLLSCWLVAAAMFGSPRSEAGEVSPIGSAIEVQDYRCEVKSDYRIECRNIGRVCETYRAKDEAESKKTFGCALGGDGAQYPDRVLIKRNRRLERRELLKKVAGKPVSAFSLMAPRKREFVAPPIRSRGFQKGGPKRSWGKRPFPRRSKS